MRARARRPRIILVALLALAAVIIPAQQALAGSDLRLTVKNDLRASGVAGYPKVAILEPESGRLYCWYTEDLAYYNRDGNAVAQGGSREFFTETKQSGSPCLTAYGENKVDLGVYLKTSPGAQWMPVVKDDATNSMSLRFEKAPDICNWNNNLDYCFVLRRSLGTFAVPTHAVPGPICWSVKSSAPDNTLRNQSATMAITVRGDAFCNTPRGQTVYPSKNGDPVYRDYPAPEEKFPAAKGATALPAATHGEAQAAPDPAPGDNEGKDEGAIVSFMSSTGVACEMMSILSAEKCKDVAKNELSNFSNLTTDVRKFRIINSFGTVDERKSICSASHTVPAGAGAGQVACTKSVAQETSTTTTTTHGWKVGASYKNSFTYKAGVPLLSGWEYKHELTASLEYNGSVATAVAKRDTVTRQVQVTQQALPGMTTKVDVFTQSADANYTFDADLDLGAQGAVQPVSTPAAEALGMSPSWTQHCLAYVVGGPGVNGSLMERQKRMLDSGMSAIDPSLPRAHQLLLQSARYYRAGKAACPGMPSMFPSTAGFTGQGVGTYASTGYGDDGKPLETWTVCVYTMPLSQPGTKAIEQARPNRREMQGTSSPCVAQKVDGPTKQVENPGRYVDMNNGHVSAQAVGGTFVGGSASEEVLGTPRADTISLGDGAMQIVRSGAGDDNVDAVRGTDFVDAGSGNDTVAVGASDTALGGPGDDRLSVNNAARTAMLGGGGDDDLTSTDSSQIGLSGGAGADRMTVTGRSASNAMAGGPGNDTYVISNTTGKAATEFEMPNQGYDTVNTDRSVTTPRYVERAVATGDQAVNLTAQDGPQTLIGNGANNVLCPGTGHDVMDGGPGDDTFFMNWDVPDAATGGTGADLFIPLGTPATAQYGGLAPHAQAHRITDFNPAEGDTIQLRAKVFGASVAQLKGNWQVAVGTSPQATAPTATILADPATGLLAFDRDGSGPFIPKVIAMVPDAGSVQLSWFAIA